MSESIVLRTYPLREADLIVSFLTRDQGKLRGVARRARRPKSGFGAGLELDSCELVRSQFGLSSDYAAGVVLDYLSEATDQLLPPAEASERHFRLLVAVLEHLGTELEAGRGGAVWKAALYFSLWAVRLGGFLPELRVSRDSGEIAEEMLKTPIGQLTQRDWDQQTGADLRRFLVRQIEEHVERKLVTVPLLEAL
ncbi:MAG: recombination protein O N-terminal domain-containing protein [Acidobacteria bacterium]|nr:recombination protein O N-terminal domain-containing protein [Acidobacteriota bacterium]